MMRRLMLVLCGAGLAVLLAGMAMQATGCLAQRQVQITSAPDFVGWVTGIEPGSGAGSGRIIVESQADKIVRRLIVTVSSDTRIYRREAGNTRQAGFSDIHLQDQAQLWLTGPGPQSFPAQATARQVVVERLY